MKQSSQLSKIKWVRHGFYNAIDSQTVKHPLLMNQVHSADVLFVQNSWDELPQVDALVTKTKGLVLTVKTADCAPVLIADTKSQIIAAIHAGWKGAFQGIIEATVLKMMEKGALLENLVAAVGPHIQKKSFQADEKMKTLFPVTEHHFFEPTENGYLFDFDGYVLHRLRRAGIQKIDTLLDDTFPDETYYSFRRDPSNPARQYSVIELI
ncbi:MAG: peptidoglycan editing factor PgeF [Alphaproteobacteria bacterium]|nr:peptidoglycan editing factor PgeF [Alphaproteobacteria bacterium]